MNILIVTVLCAVVFGNSLEENIRLKRSNSVLLRALKELTQAESEEASVGAACNCSGGQPNGNGHGGKECSGTGNNGVPWCYVGTKSSCPDLKGASNNPWSEVACANPATCTSFKTGACEQKSVYDESWTSDSGQVHGADTPRTEADCMDWCARKQMDGCCQWGKRQGHDWEDNTCNFAKAVKKTNSRHTYFDKQNKYAICTSVLTCNFVTGDGVGSSEVEIEEDLRGMDCARECHNRGFNGATVKADDSKGCWCEKGMSSIKSSWTSYKTCYLMGN